MTTTNAPVIGASYTYKQVAAFFNPTPTFVHFVLVNGSQIRALRLRKDYNPKITQGPAEIWVGATKQVAQWGNTLATHAGALPLFLKKEGATKYAYMGTYTVLPRTASAAELANARAKVPHKQGVSRIVFMNRTTQNPQSAFGN